MVSGIPGLGIPAWVIISLFVTTSYVSHPMQMTHTQLTNRKPPSAAHEFFDVFDCKPLYIHSGWQCHVITFFCPYFTCSDLQCKLLYRRVTSSPSWCLMYQQNELSTFIYFHMMHHQALIPNMCMWRASTQWMFNLLRSEKKNGVTSCRKHFQMHFLNWKYNDFCMPIFRHDVLRYSAVLLSIHKLCMR